MPIRRDVDSFFRRTVSWLNSPVFMLWAQEAGNCQLISNFQAARKDMPQEYGSRSS